MLGFSEAAPGSFDGGTAIGQNELRLYWRVIGCADAVEGIGYKFDQFDRFRYERVPSEKMLCFWEGDQHDRDRVSSVITTTVSRAKEEVTLQAITDLRLSILPDVEDLDATMRPTGIRRPRSRFSTNREKIIELEVSIDEVLGRETSAIDFTGVNVEQFCRDNGLQLIERKTYRVGNEASLAQITKGQFLAG